LSNYYTAANRKGSDEEAKGKTVEIVCLGNSYCSFYWPSESGIYIVFYLSAIKKVGIIFVQFSSRFHLTPDLLFYSHKYLNMVSLQAHKFLTLPNPL